MAKAKPKAAAKKAKTAVLAAQMKAKPKKPNPFELKGTKGHFETIGKRVSGKKQNVIQARQEAVNRRKKTLLVEYRQLRKANTFVDRRFGESNPELTETDKGIARLRAQRVKEERKKKKRGAKFTLSDGDGRDGEGLTHLGRSLADDIRGFMDRPEFDDMDEEMVEDLVAQYHFGGGGGDEEGNAVEGGEEGAQARGADGKPKTRKQIMEEIIAKSRMYRALKAKQREEDEAALEAINEEFKELVRSAGLSALIKAPGENKGVKLKADNPEDAAYDVAARELAFESKGAAGDRTLSPEELLEKEQQRLEKLEKERLKRMRGGGEEEGDDDEENDEEEDGADPRCKRRREMPSGDALGDDYDSEGEDDEAEDDDEEAGDANGDAAGAAGFSDLDRRRMKAAAGSHPLQESLRAAAAALAKKYGVEAPKNPYLDEGEDEGEEDEDEDDDEGASGGSSSKSSGEGESEEDEDAEEEQLEQRRNPAHPPSTSRPGHGPGGHGGGGEDPVAKVRGVSAEAVSKKGTGPGSAVVAKPLDGPIDLPYTIPVPSSYHEFATLVNGRPAEDLHTAISRIRAFNAIALATDSKRKMQEFYGILVQHFVMEASTSPLPVASLDTLTRVLLELTPEVPYYAATVARARVGRMAEQLTVALAALGGVAAREAAGAAVATATAASIPASPWPSPRVVMQLRLFTTLFPISDRRHPVLTPVALLLGKYLHQCIVNNPHEAAVGLCLCGLMTHMAAPAHRTAPEPLVFLRDCLSAFLPEAPARHGAPAQKKVGSSADSCNGHPKLASSGGKRKGAVQPANGFSGGEASEHRQQHQQRDPDAFVRFAPGLLFLSTKEAVAEAPPPLSLYEVLAMSPSDPRVSSNAFKLGLFRIALCAVRRAAAMASEPSLVCFEQLFEPLLSVVSELKRIEWQLPEELRVLRGEVYKQLSDASASCVASRRPLVHPARARATAAAAGIPPTAVREFNPRFEDGFVSGRDYDPDRQRAETRRLKRALVKERRGAIRELRR
ncbi:hypothetical protein VaNZ11_005999, partial [Volvox africanus]